MELLKFFNSTSKSAAKTADMLEMLEKGQLRVRTDLGFEHKALASIERLMSLLIRALMIIVLFIGYVVSIFFAWRLYKNAKNSK